MNTVLVELPPTPPQAIPSKRSVRKKRVRIIKKIRSAKGVWKFISLDRIGNRYIWDKQLGHYFLEWWDGKRRCRQLAGQTPSEAIEAQRRKQNELLGERLAQGHAAPPANLESSTRIDDAARMFIEHVKTHSPDKPETVRRYDQVVEHFKHLIGEKRKYVEAITRADIDDYKIKRRERRNERHGRPVTPRTVNFEVSTLRTFFYYLINERGLSMANPCARFKHLKDEKKKAHRKPSTYKQEELDRLFAACNEFEKAIFATLVLTGLRKRELYYLTWREVDLKRAAIKVSGEGKAGFSPKDYEELAYADNAEFNEYVDGMHDPVRVFNEEFPPSRVLFELAPEPYRLYLAEFSLNTESGSEDPEQTAVPEAANDAQVVPVATGEIAAAASAVDTERPRADEVGDD